MRKLLDALYDGAAWLAALFMIGVLVMVLLSVLGRLLHGDPCVLSTGGGAFLAAVNRDLIRKAGEALGMQASIDAGANLSLRWAAEKPEAPPIIIGSHLDSIVQGGNFDGAAGVIARFSSSA